MVRPIVHVDRTLQALRAPAAISPQKLAGGSKSAAVAAPVKSSTRRRDIADHLIAQIRSIGEDEPNRRRRAFRVFLEAKVLGLFGDQALGDPTFQSLVDQVQKAMEQDEALRGALEKTVDVLLRAVADRGKPLEDLRQLLERDTHADPAPGSGSDQLKE